MVTSSKPPTEFAVREKTSGIVHASFGNYTFAALGMRLEELKLDDRTYFRFTAANARVEFLYVLDPKNWEAIPYTATRLQFHGIAMRQCAPAMPLMRYSLGQKQHGLSEDDILNCVKQCEIELTSPHDQISDMFSALAKHFCGDAVDVAQADAQLYTTIYAAADDTDDMLLADPLLDAVYEDMDAEDKGEFREMLRRYQ